jgi:hypothetical protein
MRIVITSPKGVAPAVDPLLLGDMQAQQAMNTRFLRSNWASWKAPVKVCNFSRALPIKTIWLYGTNEATDWWDWQTLVKPVRSPLYPNEAVIYTGNGAPKYTDFALAAGVGPKPNVSYDLGLVFPTTAANVAVSGTSQSGEQSIDVFVVYTFVDAKGAESRPSPPSLMVTATRSQSIDLTLMQAPVGNNSYVAKRIYATAGASTTGYFLRGEVPAGTDSGLGSIGEKLETLDFFAPPADLKSLVYMPGNFLAGISGNEICFSEVGYFYAWPPDYRIKMVNKPVGLQVFGNSLVVATEGRQMMYNGLEPGLMQEIKGDVAFACVSEASVIDLDGMAVGYASTDGFIVVTPSGTKRITAPYFGIDEWQALNPATMHAVYWTESIVVFYDAGVSKRGALIIPVDGSEPYFWSTYATAAHVDGRSNRLYLALTDGIYRWDAGTPITWTWESKSFGMPRAKGWAALQVRSEGPVTITGKADGRDQWVVVANDSEVIPLPRGYNGFAWSFKFSSTYKMSSFAIGDSFAEIGVTG